MIGTILLLTFVAIVCADDPTWPLFIGVSGIFLVALIALFFVGD